MAWLLRCFRAMRPGLEPEEVTHKDTDQCRHAKHQRQRRSSRVQFAVRLLMNLQWEFVFRFGLLVAGSGVFGYGLVFVDSQKARIGANKTLVKDASGKLVKVLAFQRFEMTPGNLGRLGDLVQGDAPHLPFAPQPVAKYAHIRPIAFGW